MRGIAGLLSSGVPYPYSDSLRTHALVHHRLDTQDNFIDDSIVLGIRRLSSSIGLLARTEAPYPQNRDTVPAILPRSVSGAASRWSPGKKSRGRVVHPIRMG